MFAKLHPTWVFVRFFCIHTQLKNATCNLIVSLFTLAANPVMTLASYLILPIVSVCVIALTCRFDPTWLFYVPCIHAHKLLDSYRGTLFVFGLSFYLRWRETL
jgi:hypothetical protein